jgi:site-specific recombinase XerD
MKGSRPLTREQVKAVLRSEMSLREKVLLTLGFCTGYRISELLSLKISDVCTNGTIHSHVTVKAGNTKNGVGRTVLLNSDAKKALASLVEWLRSKGMNDNCPLFLSRKCDKYNGGCVKAISRQHAHDLLKGIFASVGEFGNVSTHTMRKTFAKFAYDLLGGKLEKVQAMLGHKSITSTIAYLSFNHADIDDAFMGIQL